VGWSNSPPERLEHPGSAPITLPTLSIQFPYNLGQRFSKQTLYQEKIGHFDGKLMRQRLANH
jgi:hypothetical protein